MSGTTNMHLVILWDDELRLAGRLVRKALALIADEDASQDEKASALNAAVSACSVALFDVTDKPETVLALLRKDAVPMKGQYVVAYDKDKEPTK